MSGVIGVLQLLHAACDAFTIIQGAGGDALEVGLYGIPCLLMVADGIGAVQVDVMDAGGLSFRVSHQVPGSVMSAYAHVQSG